MALWAIGRGLKPHREYAHRHERIITPIFQLGQHGLAWQGQQYTSLFSRISVLRISVLRISVLRISVLHISVLRTSVLRISVLPICMPERCTQQMSSLGCRGHDATS